MSSIETVLMIMMVKLFKNVSHEENFPAVQNVDRNMEKDLPSSLSKKMGSLKFLRRRLISHKNQSQAVYWVRVSHGKYQQQYSYGVAMKRRKTTSLGRKTPPRIQLSRNELRISDASRKSPWIRRTRKQVLSYLVHFKCNSEGSRPLVCRVYITLFISRHFLGSRVIVVIRMGCQPVSLGVRHIRSQPVRFDILRIRRHADRFSIQRTGFQPHNLNVRNIGCQQISHGTRYSRQQPVCLGVRSTACQACLQCIPVGNRGTGKHSAGCRLHCVRREKTWSRMQLPTSCIANNNGLIDSPINVSGTNNNRLGPLRTDDEYDYTYLSDDKESRHSKPEKQRTRDTGRETKTFLGSKLTPTRPGNVGLASGWWSNIRMLTLLLVCLLTGVVKSCPYAAVDPRHTICVFMPKQCPGKMLIRTGELTCHDKERILTKHNMLRQEAALGQVRGQPAAINMKTMVWDDELAMVAQRWADQCMPGHDRSRNVPRFAAGQNVAAVWTYDRDEGVEPDFLTQVEAWFMEVDQHGFSKGAVDPFKFSKPTGHYTQLVWADTYLVGCGYTYYHDAAGNGYTKLYVCNYGPGGNVVGASMYKVGYPGQPYCVANGLRPSTDYQGLCEEDGVNYKSMCSMGGSSMFHKPKTSSLMMLMHGNSVVDDFSHSHPRSNSPTHPMEVMHPDPPHMEMHDMMQHRSMMRSGQSQALHQQQSHMMLPPPSLPHNFPPNHLGGNNHQNQGGENGLMKTIQSPFAGLVNALSPWNFLNRFKMT